MKRNHGAILIGLICVFLFSCKENKKESFKVTGSFRNADKMSIPVPGGIADQKAISKVWLEEISFGKEQAPIILDSAKISGASGNFSLSGAGKPGGIFELVFGENKVQVPLINDASEIEVDVDLASSEDYYSVKGSEGSKQMQDLISGYAKKAAKIDKAYTVMDSLKREGVSDSIISLAGEDRAQAVTELNAYLKRFMFKTPNPTLAIIALGWASQSFSKTEFDSSIVVLNVKYPENLVLKNMKKSFDAQAARQAEMEKTEAANSWVGKLAPEFSMPDANGKNISLASFRGKYVLVDFWASWCGPCRNENPNVVKAYQQFKNKNFTILGVSLDKEKESWLQAIRDDQLHWTQISDLKYWNSKAVDLFKFEGIPFNVLVDPQGKIVAQQLRGDGLENKLKELLH